jgi:hypothetical protein
VTILTGTLDTLTRSYLPQQWAGSLSVQRLDEQLRPL